MTHDKKESYVPMCAYAKRIFQTLTFVVISPKHLTFSNLFQVYGCEFEIRYDYCITYQRE